MCCPSAHRKGQYIPVIRHDFDKYWKLSGKRFAYPLSIQVPIPTLQIAIQQGNPLLKHAHAVACGYRGSCSVPSCDRRLQEGTEGCVMRWCQLLFFPVNKVFKMYPRGAKLSALRRRGVVVDDGPAALVSSINAYAGATRGERGWGVQWKQGLGYRDRNQTASPSRRCARDLPCHKQPLFCPYEPTCDLLYRGGMSSTARV